MSLKMTKNTLLTTILVASLIMTGCGGGGGSVSDGGSGGNSGGSNEQLNIRLVSYELDRDLDGNADSTTTYTYDDEGRIESTSTVQVLSSSTVSNTYDDQNRVISRDRTSTYQGVSTSAIEEIIYDDSGFLVRYNYQTFDSSTVLKSAGYYLLSHIDNIPEQLEHHVTFSSIEGDVGDRVEDISTYNMNENGHLISMISDLYTVDYRWTSSGRLKSASFYTDAYTSTFDEAEYFYNTNGSTDRIITLGTPNYTQSFFYDDTVLPTTYERDIDSDGQVDERIVYTYENEVCVTTWNWWPPGYFSADSGYTLDQALHPSFIPGTGFSARCLLPEPE